MGDGDTGLNALIGAGAIIILTGTVPFGPLLGGAASGYLQGGDREDGMRVGLLAGLIALFPALVVLGFVFSIVGGVFFSGGLGTSFGLPFLGGVVALVALLFIAVYIVGLSVAGGWLGNYVRYETDIDL